MQQKISDWNKLRDKIHQTAVAHGFWENTPSDEHFLCLVISELMEAVEADRKGKYTDQSLLPHFKNPDKYMDSGIGFTGYFEIYIKDTVEDELADAVIRLLDLAGAYNVRIEPFRQEGFFEEGTFTEKIYNVVCDLVSEAGEPYSAISVGIRRICALANSMGIDLTWHIEKKMQYNTNRSYKHGKQY